VDPCCGEWVVRGGVGIDHNQRALTALAGGGCVEVRLASSFSRSAHPQLRLANLKS